MFTFISNQTHYTEVLQRTRSVKKTLWIGTADIKDLYVETRKEKRPFWAQLAELIKIRSEGAAHSYQRTRSNLLNGF